MELHDITKEAIVVAASTSFKDAVAKMIEHKTNSLLIVDEAGKLTGEVNVTDLLEVIVPDYLEDDAIAAHFATSDMFADAIAKATDVSVSEFMTTDHTAIKENDSLMALAQVAVKSKRARIPVVDEDHKPTGIVSRRGIKQLIASYLGITETD